MVKPSNLPEHNPWPQVVLAIGLATILVTGAVILLALGRSESVILTLAALIAAPALAWFATNTSQKLDQVKELSNGSVDRRDTQVEETARRQAEMVERLLALVAQTHPSIPAEVAERLMPAPPTTTETNHHNSPTLALDVGTSPVHQFR